MRQALRRQIDSSATSAAGAEWVSAPIEMRCTPVSATARTFSSRTPPEPRGAPLARRAPRRGDRVERMLSSSSESAPAATAACASANDSTSTCTRRWSAGARARAAFTACATPPASATWLSFSRIAVVEADAVVVRSAHRRRVLVERAPAGKRLARVEDRAPVPATASTKRRVRRRDAAHAHQEVQRGALGGEQRAQRVRARARAPPGRTRSPSAAQRSKATPGSSRTKTARATSSPQTTSGSRASITRPDGAARRITSALVTSPGPRSSSIARSTSGKPGVCRRQLGRAAHRQLRRLAASLRGAIPATRLLRLALELADLFEDQRLGQLRHDLPGDLLEPFHACSTMFSAARPKASHAIFSSVSWSCSRRAGVPGPAPARGRCGVGSRLGARDGAGPARGRAARAGAGAGHRAPRGCGSREGLVRRIRPRAAAARRRVALALEQARHRTGSSPNASRRARARTARARRARGGARSDPGASRAADRLDVEVHGLDVVGDRPLSSRSSALASAPPAPRGRRARGPTPSPS